MNTEVTQTLETHDLARYEYRSHTLKERETKKDLAKSEYRGHTNSRSGEQTQAQLGMNTEVTQTLDTQDLARY